MDILLLVGLASGIGVWAKQTGSVKPGPQTSSDDPSAFLCSLKDPATPSLTMHPPPFFPASSETPARSLAQQPPSFFRDSGGAPAARYSYRVGEPGSAPQPASSLPEQTHQRFLRRLHAAARAGGLDLRQIASVSWSPDDGSKEHAPVLAISIRAASLAKKMRLETLIERCLRTEVRKGLRVRMTSWKDDLLTL